MQRTILILLLLSSAGVQLYAQEERQTDAAVALAKLHWIKGPQTVPLFGIATLSVPAGYKFLNPEDTTKLNTLNQNPS
jgi:uncharacterized membrane-anchored protein